MASIETPPSGGPAPSVPSSACAPCSIVNIHVDADRDGTVDSRPGGPSWMGTRGAVILVNCDNDDGKSNADTRQNQDSADATVNGASDLPEIAPLDLRKTSEMPLEQAKVVLSVETAPLEMREYIRIFDGRAAGSQEVIGPTTGSEKMYTEADFTDGKIELGMEATRFPSRSTGANSVDFDGVVRLTLKVIAPDGSEFHSETVPVKVAPWIVFNHMDVTEKVYVAEIADNSLIANNSRFIPALRAVVGGKLEVVAGGENNGDRWAQDVMEIGHSALPGHKLVTAIRTPNLRDQGADVFGQYPGRSLLGPDYGYYLTNDLVGNSSLDSFGNLECSPPVPGFPFGRVVYGEPGTPGHRPMKEEMRALLEGQGLQAPIRLDTGWLSVGHVDEFLSFIPDASGTHGFKVAFASTDRAVALVQQAHAANPATRLFVGVTANDGTVLSAADLASAGVPEYAAHGTTAQIVGDATFLAMQTTVQGILDGQKRVLRQALGLAATDFIDLPILFHRKRNRYIAFTPGSVNMLVVTHAPNRVDMVIPKPFGPVVGGACAFETEISSLFAANAAATPHYVDCFLTYHVLSGEIHCGTNSKRIPPNRNWWQ